MPYTPPDSKLVEVSFAGAYTPPDTRLVSVDLIPPPTGNTQVLYPNAIGDYAAGGPDVQNKAVAVYPASINDTAFGTPAVANLSQGVTVAGATHTEFGTPEKVWNFHTFVRGISVGETGNDEQKPTVRNQREYLRLFGASHSLYGQPEMSHEDRGIHALAPTHTVGNLAAEKFTPACVAGGYGFFSGFTTHFENRTNGQQNIEYFWARVDYPSLTNPMKVLYTGNGRIDRDGRAVVATDGNYLYTFHVDVSNGDTSIPTLAKRDFDYNILTQATYSPSKALGSVFVIDGRLYLHTDMSALLIEEIDKDTLAPISSCSVDSSENSTSDGAYIYLNYSARRVAIFDPITNSIIGTTPMLVTPEQNGIITTHRNITRAIGVRGKIWACMYERDIDPNLTTMGVRSLLLVYDRATLTLEKTISLDSLGYSPAVATTLTETGDYVIAAPNGPVGASGYYVFDATTAAPLGGFPGVNFPSEAITNPLYEGVVPATEAVPIPTRIGRGLTNQFAIGPWNYGNHNLIEWLFPALAVFPGNKLLMSVISATEVIYDADFDYANIHYATPAATIAMRVNVENTWIETLAPEGVSMLATGAPSIRMQWQVVTPASANHSVVNEVAFQLKNRQVFPRDVFDSSFGTPAVRNNLLAPAGFDSLVVPLPDVTDRHQDIYPQSVPPDAIMGDPPRVWNYVRFITPDSTDHSYFYDVYPLVVNRIKDAGPIGYAATRWGVLQIANAAVVLLPDGLDATVYGDSNTTNWYQYRGAAGTDMALVGAVDILNSQIVIHPRGTDMSALGEDEISLKQRALAVDGVASPLQDSEPWVSLYIRTFGHFGGISMSAVAAPEVAHDVRYLLPQTFLPAVFGWPNTDLARREILPEGVFFDTPAAAFGPPNVSPYTNAVAPLGQDCAVVSEPATARNEVVIEQATLGSQSEFGATQIELARRHIYQTFAPETSQYGAPSVWNWRTYVSTSSEVGPDAFGWCAAELRNKTLYPSGYDMTRVGAYTTISNNARLVGPEGSDLTQFGDTLIADRIREVIPDGEDQALYGYRFFVANRSQVIAPGGVSRPYAGVPRVWRNEQPLDAIGGWVSDGFGAVLVADRIRTITQYRYADPVAGLPTVALYTQYVEPQGFAERFGWVSVEHFRNEAHIFGTDYAQCGEPTIRNFNPQVWLGGIDKPDLYGGPWVSLRVRQIDLTDQAIPAYSPNQAVIAFRTRIMRPQGYATDAIPRTHDIRWDMPMTAPEQRIVPAGIGIQSIPSLFVRGNVIFPDSTDQARCGRPDLTANSIWPTSNLSVFSFVEAPTVSLRNRTIFIKTTQLPAVFNPSRVVMSPYFVGPFGDIRAAWLIDAHLADGDDPFSRPFFGAPTVTNYYRSISTVGIKPGMLGLPVLATNQMAPDGWDSNEGKFGMADFAGPIYIAPYWGRTTEDYLPEIPAYNFDTALYGQPDFAYPVTPPVWSPYLLPAGLHSFDPGRPSIESTIRNVYPVGTEYEEEWVSYVWLHPPFHLYPEGVVPLEPAISQIAFRIRELVAQGDDMAVVCEEDAQMISARFRVRNGASRYALDGIAPEAPAILQITHRNRSIAVGAIPEGVTSPARVQAQNLVMPAGTDTAQLGIIRRAVYGEIYPYAPDMAQYGYPKTNRRAYTGGVAAPAVADIRVARPLRPQGADCMGAGGAAVTNPYGCRDRAIIVGGDTDFSTFGETHATN